MELVRTWRRQVARAAGASLIAPLALLLAAGAVASGGGLGGLGSLGQVASGPSLPDTGLAGGRSRSLEGAEIVGADVAEPPPAPASPPAAAAELAAAPPPPAAPRGAAPAARPRRPQIATEAPRRPDTSAGTLVDSPEGGAPPAAAEGLEDLQETTEGLDEALPEPLQPVGRQLLDLLGLLPRLVR